MVTGILLAVVVAAGVVTRRLWPDAIVRAVGAAVALGVAAMLLGGRASWQAPVGAVILFLLGFAVGMLVRRARAPR